MPEMKAETSKVLMSEVLRGRVDPSLEDEATVAAADALEEAVVDVIANIQLSDGRQAPIAGILRSVLFENEPELEFRVQLGAALDLVSATNVKFMGFELHHGERTIQVPGPFLIKGVRIDDIDPLLSLCVLSLGLRRPPRA